MPWQGHPRTSTTPHRRWRAAVLTAAPTCQCQGCRHHQGRCTQPSTEADHIVAVADGGKTVPQNGQALCHPCHQAKTNAEAAAARWKHKARREPEAHPGLRR